MILSLVIFTLILFVVTNAYFRKKDELEIYKDYKEFYFKEQEQSEAYRACLYIAIQDMINNGWYKNEAVAFKMLFCRIKPYKFIDRLNRTVLASRMLYNSDHVKFSHDYEQELIDGRCK